jgi:hypothetical protein
MKAVWQPFSFMETLKTENEKRRRRRRRRRRKKKEEVF